MRIDDLTIGEAKELAKLFGGAVAAKPRTDEGINLVILDRGFVYVGYVSVDGDWVYITSAKNVRYWGTSKGLGELVNGPLSGTKLDTVGTVKVPLRAMISMIKCEDTKWKSEL
jgi:hypothetical protein